MSEPLTTPVKSDLARKAVENANQSLAHVIQFAPTNHEQLEIFITAITDMIDIWARTFAGGDEAMRQRIINLTIEALRLHIAHPEMVGDA